MVRLPPTRAPPTLNPRRLVEILQELRERGTLKAETDPGLAAWLQEAPRTLYCGFDPTGDSLHIGNLVPLMALKRFALAGHRPIALLGGATGMIGDPSGRDAERHLLDDETVGANLTGIRRDIERVLGEHDVTILNNRDWIGPLTVVQFLRDIGKHFRVNVMVKLDSVRTRLEREEGISYTEFSYSLIQAYDFLHLARVADCQLQIGASDQWGNITAGLDLIRSVEGKHAFGLTLDLLLDAEGKKFGKSSGGGGLFLSPERTPPYALYQHLLNTSDDGSPRSEVDRYLRIFSLRPLLEIEELIREHDRDRAARLAQRT